MSDLRPRGVTIDVGGEKRELLFTLNVMDDIQGRTGEPVFSCLQKLFEKESLNASVRILLSSLLTDEEMCIRDSPKGKDSVKAVPI